jgi:TetR/AcrR family transcriptional regulator, cholesterol catabolism regulator
MGMENREGRWPALLDAAAECFRDKGYVGTSVQDIASAVGLLKGSVYHYIRSKEDLLFAVVDEHHRAVFENVERTKTANASYVEKLRSFFEWHVSYNASHSARASVFYNEYRYLSADRLAHIIAARDAYENEVRLLLLEGREAGVVRLDVDPKWGAMFILNVLNSVHQWYGEEGSLDPDGVAEQFAGMLLDGLLIHRSL